MIRRLWRRLGRNANGPDALQAGPPIAPAAPAAGPSDPLDTYATGTISLQATVDIFKGVWSSELPAHLGVTSGSAKLFDDPRIHWMIERLGSIAGWRVLELGPLEGGHSYMLQQAGAEHVMAVDACAMSYLKCLVVKDLCRLTRVDFRYGDFMAFLETDDAAFDLIVASGVLYHQRDPVACIKRMAARCDRVFLWTHYYSDGLHSPHMRSDMFVPVSPRRSSPGTEAADAAHPGSPVPAGKEFSCELFRLDYDTYLPGVKYRGGVDDHSHWMRREDILSCLRHYGLTDIEVAFDQQEHPFGPNFALLARRPGGSAAARREANVYREQMRAISGPEPWCVDTIRMGKDFIEVTGWAIPPAGVVGRMGFLVDGQPVSMVDRGRTREDVAAYYWFFPSADRSGFSFRHPIDPRSDAPVLMQYADLATGLVIAPQHDLGFRPSDLRGEKPAPALALIQRTHTGNSVDQYFVEGYSIYRSVMRCFKEATGRAIGSVGCVLDFGCGPGRLTRYLLDEPGLKVVAVDVDPACVDWCRDHLGAASCRLGPLRPPLALEARDVGCVLAIDVMQHLGERDGLGWLAEWARICNPGGTLLVSIASELALSRAGLGESHYASVKGFDFLDLSRNPDLDGVISDPGYYRNVFHSHDYVKRVWPSLGLEVQRIVPGCIGNHHDLVILRRLA